MDKEPPIKPLQDSWAEKVISRVGAEPQLSFLTRIYREFPESEWYLVGGAVRDIATNQKTIKDYDLMVRKIDLASLADSLRFLGRVDLVGRSFGVLKFRPKGSEGREDVDIAWPRTERAGMSGGYRDFEVQSSPELSVEWDLERRDFTMNSIAVDLRRGTVIDPFNGRGDVERRLVRAVGLPEKRFAEDYSRMLRAIRQACQLGFEIESETWNSIKRLAPHLDDERVIPVKDREDDKQERMERVVPYETVAKEMIKAFRADAGRALELLESSGMLFRLIPELRPLVGCDQHSENHFEGDAWIHTKLALSALESEDFRNFFPGERPEAETAFAVLLHDIGKPPSRQLDAEGKTTFYGHPDLGAHMADAVVRRLKLSAPPGGFDAERVVWLVRNHMLPVTINVDEIKRSTLTRYFLEDKGAGQGLLHLSFADSFASRRADGGYDDSKLRRLKSALDELSYKASGGRPPRLVGGQEVMSIQGLPSGPDIGRILADLEEAQLRGEVSDSDQAREFVRQYIVEK